MREKQGRAGIGILRGFMALCLATAAIAAVGVKSVGDLLSDPLPPLELPEDLTFDRLLVEKGERRLTAFSNGEPLRVYRIALGFAPEGHKEVEGDGKTPEGVYYVDGKNPNSRYYKNLGVSYPNEQDRAHAQNLGLSPGGDIKIHGLPPGLGRLGEVHWLKDWTAGCIAVSNEEIDELYTRTPVGTPIEILP